MSGIAVPFGQAATMTSAGAAPSERICSNDERGKRRTDTFAGKSLGKSVRGRCPSTAAPFV
jgi:hypothetical protein